MAVLAVGVSEIEHTDDADEARSIEQWAAFLSSYSRGAFPAESYPPLPPMSPRRSGMDSMDAPVIPDVDDLYPSSVINEAVAQNVRDYISAHSYFPPPRAADERLREQCIQEYDLLGDAQRSNVNQAVDLLAAFFPDTVCTFTIFNGPKQSFVAVAGDQATRDEFGLYDDFVVRSDLGLCGHCVLVKEQLMFVPSLKGDWRFNGNPYTQAGIQSYIGAPITLPINALATSFNTSTRDDGREERVGVGALNVLFVKKPLEELSDTQAMVVRNIARMMETHLRATWDGARRTIEAKYRRAVAEMIEEAFVGKVSPPSALAEPVASTLIDGTVGTTTGPIASLQALARTAVENIMALVPQLDSVIIVDTRNALHAITTDNVVADPAMPGLPILASSGNAMAAPSTQSLASLINRRSSRCVFDAAHPSGLEEQLAFDSRAHIVMPFSIHDRPAFTLIATSHRAQSFSSSCINHIRSLGALLLARFSQDAVIEADAAKTIFLSSISHELRTPLHSMLVALRLAFDHVQEGEWESLGPLLEAMRSSSVALQGTLEDVLDFGMSQTGSPALSTRSRTTAPGAGTPEVSAKSKFSMVDLVESVRGAVQLCLMQRPASHERMVGFAYESRDWGLRINEAQFRRGRRSIGRARDRRLMARIVVNGVTNALKFCSEGSIDIRLGMHDTDRDFFQLSITDDGPGIEPSLIPRLLEPFTKRDVHTPGIGLGLHITKTLVQNLGGRLDITSEGMRGVRFTVTLPWTYTQDRTRNDRPLDPQRHGMSDLMREVISVASQCTAPHRSASAHSARHDSSGGSSSGQSNDPPLQTPKDDVQDPLEPHPGDAIADGLAPIKVSRIKDIPGEPACDVEPMRIMIIDDNDICRRLLAALVLKMVRKTTNQSSQQMKPLVRQYSDGQSAVDSFLAFRPHLVLTDVSMPGMDGVTAAQHMRMLGQQQGAESSGVIINGQADITRECAAVGSTQWPVDKCLIYAITGLGSSDPRLRASGMLGNAALDGWLVKGKDDMPRVEEIVQRVAAKLRYGV